MLYVIFLLVLFNSDAVFINSNYEDTNTCRNTTNDQMKYHIIRENVLFKDIDGYGWRRRSFDTNKFHLETGSYPNKVQSFSIQIDSSQTQAEFKTAGLEIQADTNVEDNNALKKWVHKLIGDISYMDDIIAVVALVLPSAVFVAIVTIYYFCKKSINTRNIDKDYFESLDESIYEEKTYWFGKTADYFFLIEPSSQAKKKHVKFDSPVAVETVISLLSYTSTENLYLESGGLGGSYQNENEDLYSGLEYSNSYNDSYDNLNYDQPCSNHSFTENISDNATNGHNNNWSIVKSKFRKDEVQEDLAPNAGKLAAFIVEIAEATKAIREENPHLSVEMERSIPPQYHEQVAEDDVPIEEDDVPIEEDVRKKSDPFLTDLREAVEARQNRIESNTLRMSKPKKRGKNLKSSLPEDDNKKIRNENVSIVSKFFGTITKWGFGKDTSSNQTNIVSDSSDCIPS